jgi:hypothetical protein
MGRDRDQPWSYRYGDLTPSRPDQFGNPSLAGEPMIRLERVPAQNGCWHRERLQVVRTFPITPFCYNQPGRADPTANIEPVAHLIRVPPHRSIASRFWRWLSRNGVAISISLMSAAFTGWQGYEAHQARRDAIRVADQARKDAKGASDKQLEDVQAARKAAEESAKAAQDLAKGMERSAKAAEQSAVAGRDSLLLNRRALVLSNVASMQIFNSRLAKALTAGEIPAVTTKVFNGGKGTAYKLEISQWLRLSPTREFIYEHVPDPRSLTDVPPGSSAMLEMNSKFSSAITAEQIKLIEARQLMLYVYGRAIYYDNTLEKPRKYTWYWCNLYSHLDDGSDKQLLGICPEHNYTVVE